MNDSNKNKKTWGLFLPVFFYSNIISSIRSISILFISTMFLIGCATKTPPQQLLGISETQWNSYDKEKHKELLQIYNQIALANQTEDEKVNALVDEQNKNRKTIEVKVSEGSSLMPPFTAWQAFVPAVFTIDEGTCQEVWLTQLDGTARISLRGCYKDKLLRLDPSRYELDKQNGTASIPYSPLWDQGFTYHDINSYGYVKLKKATVTITIKQSSAIEKNEVEQAGRVEI